MEPQLIRTNTLTYIDIPKEDERTACLERLPVEERPPIIVVRSPLSRFTGRKNKVIVDGHRRALIHPYWQISAYEISTDEDLAQARNLILNKEHFLHQDTTIINMVDFREVIRIAIMSAIDEGRPLHYSPKYRQKEFPSRL